jgi:hypothetical protein
MKVWMKTGAIQTILLFAIQYYTVAQGTVPGYHDAALSRNKLLREQQGEGVYKLIGPYKVTGTSYLFGERHNGNVFTPSEKAYNININYNTYNQEVEFYSTSNPATPLIKEPGEVDSFILKSDIAAGISNDIRFVYGPLAGSSEKAYFQVIAQGPKYSLYKRYKSELGIVSTNYIQSELRQFDMTVDYFYYDVANKKFKKLKWNINSIIKEFKSVKDITPVADSKAFEINPEAIAQNIFAELNQ